MQQRHANIAGVLLKKQSDYHPISRALYTDFQEKTCFANELNW